MVGTGDNENKYFWSILIVTTIVDIDIFLAGNTNMRHGNKNYSACPRDQHKHLIYMTSDSITNSHF